MRRLLLHSLLPVLLLTLLFSQSEAAMQGVRSGVRLWADAVLPALLPFYITTELLQQCGALRLFSPLMRPVCRLMRLPDAVGGLLLSGWLCGAPAGARLLAQSQDDPAVCTSFCACATVTGPLFLIGTAGQLLGSPMLGATVYGIHLLAALCNGLLWRSRSSAQSYASSAVTSAPMSILSALPEALRSSSLALLFIGGAIAFFSALTNVLHAIGLTPALEHVLRSVMPTDAVSALLAGFFEVSQGVVLAAQGRLSLPLRLSLLCAFSSFGGLSVLCQSKVFLKGRVRASIYFFQRTTHAALSFVLCRVLCLISGSALPATMIEQSFSSPSALSMGTWFLPMLCLTCSLLPHITKGR